jgi:hypothetical protein
MDLVNLQVLASMLFVFAVVFGTLSVVNKFNSRVNILIALVFAFSVLSYTPFLEFIWNLMPIASILIILLFFIRLILDVFKIDQNRIDATSLVVSLGLILLVLGSVWNHIFEYYIGTIPSTDLLWGIAIVIFLLMLFSVSKGQSHHQ